MEILITICARGGSKGIPGKNIKLLNGKPLILYTIRTAQAFAELYTCDIIVSTDDEKIKSVAEKENILVRNRPAELATDSAGKIETIRDALVFCEKNKQKQYDYVLDMDVTSPLRTTSDLKEAFSMIIKDEQAYNIFSVNHANRNPYFNMVEQKPDGYYHLVKEGQFLSRQTAPAVYDMNASFYFYKRSFFSENIKTSTTNRSLVYIMKHICFDLDHPLDFDFMEYLIAHDKLGFVL